MSNWQGLHTLGPIAVIARNARTLLGGVEAIARYLYVHSPALKLTPAPRTPQTGLAFTYEVTQPGLPDVVQTYEISMAIAVRIIRLLGGPEARPNVISFMHDQQGTDAAYRETLGCRVRFRQTWCGFELPHRLADRRIESADPETRRIAAKYLESNYLPRTASLSDRVAELTRRLLPTGQCSVDAIADQLAMHPRSLQRGLATEGVRCQDLIERERRALAARYLAEPGLHLSQIAGLVGYTEQSTLNHSCRRWFGKTPAFGESSVPHGPQTKPGAVMASPRPRRCAPRSQAFSPCRGSDPGSARKSRHRREPAPVAPAAAAARSRASPDLHRLARPPTW